MEFKVTLEFGLPFIKFSVRFIFCWPLLLNPTTADLNRSDTSWMITFGLSARGFTDLLISAFHARGDAEKLTDIFLEISSIFISLFKIITFRCQDSRQQIWIAGVMQFLKIVSSRGREILQRYEYKFLPFYGLFESSATLFMARAVSSESMFPMQPLHSNFHYFSAWEDSPIIQAVIHFLIVFATFPLTAGQFMHSEILGLQWLAKMGLELSAEKLMTTISSWEFDKCIEKLQKVTLA